MQPAPPDSQLAMEEVFHRIRHVRIDGRLYFCVLDLFAAVSGKTPKAVSDMLREPNIANKPEVLRLTARVYKFPGRGQRAVAVVTQHEALELKDHLPPCYSRYLNAHIRQQVMRVHAGDLTLLEEIRNNAASNGLLQQSARECLVPNKEDRTDSRASSPVETKMACPEKIRSVRIAGIGLCVAVSDLFAGLSGKTGTDVNIMLNKPHIASNPAVIRLTARLHKFPGRGQKAIPVVTQEEALELKDHLPKSYSGDLSAYMQEQFMRVNGGDETIVNEVRRNAASDGLVQQSARDCLGIAHVPTGVVADDAEERLLKRRKMIADIEAQEAVTQEKLRLLPIKVATETRALLESFATSEHLDAKERQILHDYTLNLLLPAQPQSSQALLTDGAPATPADSEEDKELTITEVLRGLGATPNAAALCAVGRIAAAMYREKYGAEPRKSQRLANGTYQDVNWYARRDAGLLQDAARRHLDTEARRRAPGQLSMNQFVRQ